MKSASTPDPVPDEVLGSSVHPSPLAVELTGEPNSASPILVSHPTGGAVAVVTLNRPAVLNALDPPLLSELRRVLEEIGRSDEVGCAVLTGAGRAFSAGADLKVQQRMTAAEFRGLTETLRDIAFTIRGMGKPLIAAVNGFAIAGGFELACLCDIRVVAQEARLGAGDADVNMSPTSGLSWLLPRIVGLGRAKYLALACPMIDGQKAFEMGLADEVVPLRDLLPRALALAGSIAEKPRLGIRLTKLALDVASEVSYDAAVRLELELEDHAFTHPDSVEARDAFIEKRKPVFRRR